MIKHKFLVLDSPYGIIEDYTNLEYIRERFGLGTFSIKIPVDHAQANALVKDKRILIIRFDEDNQEARFWGIIRNVKSSYETEASSDLGRSGIGGAYIIASGETYTSYLLASRAYLLPDPITLLPNGDGTYTAWTGTWQDIDEGVDL